MEAETRVCQNCKKDFTIEPEDFNFYEKIKVPPPTWCPECRMRRRMSWRNERTLYKRKCDLCGQVTFSMYPESSVLKIYCPHCWYSDSWDAISYGQNYDFSKPFFIQLKELFNNIPFYSIFNSNSINCTFGGNLIVDSKNLYLSYSTLLSENVCYSKNIEMAKFVFDSLDVSDSDNIYEGNSSRKNYNCSFILNCRNCIDCRFLYDCVNCHDCILSSNLHNKEFYIRNKKYTKENYFAELKKINFGNFQEQERLIREFNETRKNSVHKYANLTSCINCTGDDQTNSKNTKMAFDGYDLENMAFTMRNFSMKDSYDICNNSRSQLVYEAMGGGMDGSSNISFNLYGAAKGHNHDLQYCMSCANCSYCFASIGLRNKQYCILNKQYTKEEYETLVGKIIKQMNDLPYIDNKGRIYKYGEFFPPELSPFSYNETIAQEYFPLTKEEALKQGYKWKDREERNYTIDIQNEAIPDNIEEIDDSIINKVIECEHQGTCNEQCTEAFKIIEPELQFYRRMNLPLPRLCPNCRHYQRLKQRNPLKLWHRHCMKENCPNEFETSYAPDRPEIVYCEECYKKEVY